MKNILACIGISLLLCAGKAQSQYQLPDSELRSPVLENDIPSSFKLKQFFQDLYAPIGQKHLYVVGDSINATNSPNRMSVGYRNNFRIPWNSWFVHADSGVSDNGFINGQNATVNEIRLPGDVFTNGYTDVAPVRTRDLYYGNQPGNGWTLSDGGFLSTSLSQFRLGNPLFGPISAKVIYYNCPTTLPSFTVQSTVNFNGYASAIVYRAPGAFLASQTVPIAVPQGSTPGLRIVSNSVSASSVAPERQLTIVGVSYTNSNPDGVRFTPIAHGGWKIPDHINNYSNSSLNEFFSVNGYPTHIMIWLGQNQTPQESSALSAGDNSVIKQDYKTLIAKYSDTVFLATGFRPKVLLVSQYQTGYFPATHKLIAKAQYEISSENSLVSFLNLYKISGEENFDKITYLSDGVHPNLTGTNHLSILIDEAAWNSVFTRIQIP